MSMTHLKKYGYQEKADFFDEQANTTWATDDYGPEERDKLERLQLQLKNPTGKIVLEPGCGTGRLTEILADWVGPTGRVTALDISPKMMDQAQQRLAGRKNVTLAQTTLEELNIEPASFDIVLHHQVFPHYNDPSQALKITAQALKPGGSVIVFHFINKEQINDLHRKAGTAVEQDMLPPDETMAHLFLAAGLQVNDIINNEKGYFLNGNRPA